MHCRPPQAGPLAGTLSSDRNCSHQMAAPTQLLNQMLILKAQEALLTGACDSHFQANSSGGQKVQDESLSFFFLPKRPSPGA